MNTFELVTLVVSSVMVLGGLSMIMLAVIFGMRADTAARNATLSSRIRQQDLEIERLRKIYLDGFDDGTNAVCQTMQEHGMCNCEDGKCLAAEVSAELKS